MNFQESSLSLVDNIYFTSRTPERYHRPLLLNSQYPIYGCLIYSFLRPPPSRQQRIIIVALHPHLIDQLQSSRKSFSLKNHCESAVSNSTISNSFKSREGSRMGAKMSKEVSRSSGGYTSHDSTSTSHPVPRGLDNAYSTSTSKGITGANSHLISSSFGPSFRSNNPPLQPMEGNYTGANTSLKVCLPSKSQGISYPESGLRGAEMSGNYGVHAVGSPYAQSGPTGAEMSGNYGVHAVGSPYAQSGPTGAEMSRTGPAGRPGPRTGPAGRPGPRPG